MSQSISLQSVVVAGKDQIACSLGEDVAILSTRNGVYYGLDPIGARVWKLLQEPRSVDEICLTLLDEYEVGAERCEADLFDLLQRLSVEGLIEVRDGARS